MSRPCASSSLRALPASDRWMSKNEASGVCGGACVIGSTFCVDIDLFLQKQLVVFIFLAFSPVRIGAEGAMFSVVASFIISNRAVGTQNAKPPQLLPVICAAHKTGQCCSASRFRPADRHAFRSGLDTVRDICVQFLT